MSTTIRFPNNLSNPHYPLKETREDNVLRSSFEAGYEQTRQRYTRIRRTYGLNWDTLPTSERDILMDFYDSVTRNGSLSFVWAHPITGETAEYRFTKPIECSLVNVDRWSVTAEIRMV